MHGQQNVKKTREVSFQNATRVMQQYFANKYITVIKPETFTLQSKPNAVQNSLVID